MRVVKDRDNQNLGLSNKIKRQYKDRESIKDNTLFSFSNIYDCYKYIKDNIPGFADLFYSEKYDINISRSIKIIQIVCRANANIGIAITQDPCEENDKLYICSGNNERQMFKYMSKHCPDAVIENTGIMSAAKYYYGNTEDDCHSISSTLLDVIISYLKKASSRKYPEHLRAPESMFRGVLESKQEAYPDIQLIEHKVDESSNLGFNSKVKKKFDKVDTIVNASQIPFKDPEVEKICHDHGVYTVDDATRVTSVDEWFSGNSVIKTFNEFKYFTGIETIYENFDRCTSLQSINIPNSVTSIGTSAFGFCESLRSIDIPNSVTYIGYYSFYKCTSLQSVTIPNTVTTIRVNAFHGCTSLQSINISKDSLVYDQIKKQFPDTQLIEPNQKLLKRAGLVESVVRENKETNITNSQGQDVPELGKHAENVYLPDCPFMIGKDQVDWFEYFQREKEKHTIKDVDDFIQSAKKETKLIKESCKQKVNALEWFVALKESSALGLSTKVKKNYEDTHGQDIDINQLADFIRPKVYVAAGYSPDEDAEKVDYNLRVYVMGNCLVTDGMRICDESGFYNAIDTINSDIEREKSNIYIFKNLYLPLYKAHGEKSLEASALESIEKSNRQVSGLTTVKNELEAIGWFSILKAMTNSRD